MKPCLLKPWIAAVILLGSVALAHQPWFNPGSRSAERAFVIPDPQISKVITAEGTPGAADWYKLEVNGGFRLDVALFVSASCAKVFNPRLYLIGRDLQEALPFRVPQGMGGLAVAPDWTAYSGHGVTGRKTETLIRALKAGTYYLVVQHGEARGWYFLSLGGLEISGGTNEGRAALARFQRCE
jgi:hypothetical protein